MRRALSLQSLCHNHIAVFIGLISEHLYQNVVIVNNIKNVKITMKMTRYMTFDYI